MKNEKDPILSITLQMINTL